MTMVLDMDWNSFLKPTFPKGILSVIFITLIMVLTAFSTVCVKCDADSNPIYCGCYPRFPIIGRVPNLFFIPLSIILSYLAACYIANISNKKK